MESIVDKDGKIYQFEKHYIEIALSKLINQEVDKLAKAKIAADEMENKKGILYESIINSFHIMEQYIHELKIVLARVQSMEVHK